MPYTQETRFITIDTPLGPDVLLLKSLNGNEAISSLFNFKLELLSEDPSVSYDDIVGQNVTLTIRMIDGSERYFNGFISKFSQSGSDENFTYYSAEMVPWLWFLTLTSDCRIFQNMTAPEIIEKVFSDAGFSDFKNELQGSFRKRVYCVQYRETDFNFVSRLMEEEGIYYFFEHEQGKHTLVMGNSTSVHQPCPGQEEARYQTSGDGFLEEDTINGWEIQKEVRPGKYALTDYNFEMPSTSLAANISSNGKHEIYDYPGEYSQKSEGDSLVKVRLEEEETPTLVVRGSSTCRAFATGFRFDLFDHYREDMNTSYVLTSINHSANETSYASGGGGEGDLAYFNHFTCIPADVPFRPARMTPKPLVQGPQTAVIVGPGGEEIWVDKYGRVKVQFHWDREGKKDENSSCWIRVAQHWAGKQWGTMFIPRIGQEVIIDFLEGDPDRPIITGRVYNAEQMPPYELPAEQTKSTIKTRSSKGGSPDNFNEIRFEDKKGEEQLFIHAEKNQDIEVENDETHWVGNDRTKTIDRDETSHIKRDRTETVDRHETITIGENRTEKVGKDETITIDNDRTEQVKNNETVKVDSNRSHTIGKNDDLDVGKVLSITAGDQINIKTGSASIVMKSNGDITISGKKITIKGSGNVIIKGKKILEN
ncbi:MAG: type VI secretion system Vgr family protein [bacterium]